MTCPCNLCEERGETKYIPLVVVDGKVVMAAEEGE